MIALIHIYCSTSLCVIYKSSLIHDIQVLIYRGSTNERLPGEGVAYDSYYNETDHVTDISRRFSKRILLRKQKGGDNQTQETVEGKQKKKDLEMQTISKPLTLVAQAVTNRLCNENKISKGGPVKKFSTKATRGRGRSRKNSSVKNSAV